MAIISSSNSNKEEEQEEEQTIKIVDIKIGDRLRKKIRDVSSLADSISRHGLLHPIVIDENNELIGGARRIAAFIQLGRDRIPYRRVSSSNPVQAEYDENVERSDFALEDIAEIYKRVQASRLNHRPAAADEGGTKEKEKQLQLQQDNNNMMMVGNLPTFPKGPSDIVTGKICGHSEQNINKIVKMVAIAKEKPELQYVVDQVDNREKSLLAAFGQMIQAQERAKPKPKPPEGQYDILYVDVPWTYGFPGMGAPENHYATMTHEELMQMVMPAADNAVLFLWVPYPKTREAFDILDCWGFEFKSEFVWVKDRIGTGHHARGQHEKLWKCVKGDGLGVPAEEDRTSTVIYAERTNEHSRKPEIFYEIIEKQYPGRSRIELFARGEPREGWTTWGAEATGSVFETIEEEEQDDDLKRFEKFGRPAFQNQTPRMYNVWNFVRFDPRLGIDHPGKIPGQIAQNVLVYYTKKGDLVVDPMAGGGSTIDACRSLDRRCLAYDVDPIRKDINKWDIVKQGFPEEAKGRCKLVFLDPPYGSMIKDRLSKDSISSLSIEGFLQAMHVVAKECYEALAEGGHVALVMEGITDENYEYFIDFPVECILAFRAVGFKQKQRISVPIPAQAKSAVDIYRFKKRKQLLNRNRDLIIFKKTK